MTDFTGAQALSLYQKAAELLQCVYETAKSLCQPSKVQIAFLQEQTVLLLCILPSLLYLFLSHTLSSFPSIAVL